ncbi:ATP-binding cassette domain-containing protein, partial [Bacillus altitudinis]|uniref:ATP-binding cassette domain-containing protein n=1 Tax=Bacillus altitudinis TaxID=293387 RepID=UPI001F3A9092
MDDIDVDMDEGDMLGLIGGKGGGKRRFFNMITGIWRGRCGRFMMMKMRWLKKVGDDMGVVGEYRDLYEGVSGIEDIGYLWKIRGSGEKRRYYEELVEFVGLDGYDEEKVGAFTAGMKKWLGMVEAMV